MIILNLLYEIIPGTKVFSLNFSSAGKGQFIAGKAKRCTRGEFSWRQGGSGLRDMAPPLLGNLEAKPLWKDILSFYDVFYANRLLLPLHYNFKQLILIILPSVFNVPFPKCVAHKKESCVNLILFHIIHLFLCGMWESDRITTCIFFRSTSLILVNFRLLQTVNFTGYCLIRRTLDSNELITVKTSTLLTYWGFGEWEATDTCVQG